MTLVVAQFVVLLGIKPDQNIANADLLPLCNSNLLADTCYKGVYFRHPRGRSEGASHRNRRFEFSVDNEKAGSNEKHQEEQGQDFQRTRGGAGADTEIRPLAMSIGLHARGFATFAEDHSP